MGQGTNAGEHPNMSKRHKLDPAVEAVLRQDARTFGGRDKVLELYRMGLLTLPKRKPRCHIQCSAFARTTGKPCRAPGNGAGFRCKLHGGGSIGAQTKRGLERIRATNRKRWKQAQPTSPDVSTPWGKQGVSKRTWQRHRAAKRLATLFPDAN
jgi:hypothetical protein